MVDCVDGDLTGEVLNEAVDKDLIHWLQVKGKMGRSFGMTPEGDMEVYTNHLVAGGLYMRRRRKNGTEVQCWCCLQWCLESKNF